MNVFANDRKPGLDAKVMDFLTSRGFAPRPIKTYNNPKYHEEVKMDIEQRYWYRRESMVDGDDTINFSVELDLQLNKKGYPIKGTLHCTPTFTASRYSWFRVNGGNKLILHFDRFVEMAKNNQVLFRNVKGREAKLKKAAAQALLTRPAKL